MVIHIVRDTVVIVWCVCGWQLLENPRPAGWIARWKGPPLEAIVRVPAILLSTGEITVEAFIVGENATHEGSRVCPAPDDPTICPVQRIAVADSERAVDEQAILADLGHVYPLVLTNQVRVVSTSRRSKPGNGFNGGGFPCPSPPPQTAKWMYDVGCCISSSRTMRLVRSPVAALKRFR